MTNRFTQATELAAAAQAAGGVANEARRKEINEALGRAYEEVRRATHLPTWDVVVDAGKGAFDRYYDLSLPHELHHLRAKHTNYILELCPELVVEAGRAQELFALRAMVKAMPVLPKALPRKQQPIVSGDKTQQRGHCQCCGRVHAVRGWVAQHGYTIKHGYFKGVCPGQHYLPLEKSRVQTDAAAAEMLEAAREASILASKLRLGTANPGVIQIGYGRSATSIPFPDGTATQQREAIETAIAAVESRAYNLPRMAADLKALADRVHGQPLLIVKL